MLTKNQKRYLNLYVSFLNCEDQKEASKFLNEMDYLYSSLTFAEMDEIEEWIDRYKRQEDTEDISDLGYEPGEQGFWDYAPDGEF